MTYYVSGRERNILPFEPIGDDLHGVLFMLGMASVLKRKHEKIRYSIRSAFRSIINRVVPSSGYIERVALLQ